MYGVVLWADEGDSKAVIWCEDHGNLAFYNAGENSAVDGLNLDAGDLIKFDLKEHENMRMARNPKVVEGEFSRGLAQRLQASGQPNAMTGCSANDQDGHMPAPTVRGDGVVLSLADYREARLFPA